MPKKLKLTKDEIADVAFSMVRKHGEQILSARNLAEELGMSTAPIFTAFSGIGEVMNEVVARAKALYTSYLLKGLEMTPPFKGAGLKYIQFAKDEPQLFKLLFMRGGGEVTHYFPGGDENEPIVLEKVKNGYGIDTESARKIYNHLSVYVHGLAVMFAQGGCVFSDDDISRMLSEIFISVSSYFNNKNGD